jgi:Tfp pilus assembly PilM family ATPase
MIKDIFLPEKINSFYLFTQRIVAFEIGNHAVFATIVRAHRNKRTLQKFLEASYNSHEPESLRNAILALIKKIGAYDVAYVALSSSAAIFKTMELPFTSLEKIKLIMPFEVEPLLPFPLQEAAIDVVVNNINATTNRSDVFVAAMKHSTLEIALQPFIQAGIRPQRVTIGALELYGFMQENNVLKDTQGVSCIIDINQDNTTVLLLVQGKLRSIRVLPSGITEELLRIDLDQTHEDLHKEMLPFFASIQFTLQAMLKNEKIYEPITSALLSGTGAHLPGMTSCMQSLLGCPCTAFHPHKVIHAGLITLENESSIPPAFTTTVATAVSSAFTADFNLDKEYESVRALHQFKIQVISALSLFVFMLASLLLYSFLTTRSLKQELEQSKSHVINELNQAFNLGARSSKSSKSLTLLMSQAEEALALEKSLWFALSDAQRHSFLRYLQELTTHINRDELGLNMKRLILKREERGETKVNLEGSVKDYDAVRRLDEALQATQLFTYVPEQQKTEFNISLAIPNNQEDSI